MSDRVGYMAGNTIRRDHIQWPTILRSEIPSIFGPLTPDQEDEMWPGDFTLAQIMTACWRVKKWKLTGNCTAYVSRSEPGFLFEQSTAIVTLSETMIVAQLNGAEATRERDLVGKIFAANSTPYKALVYDGILALAASPVIANWSYDGDISINLQPPVPFSGSGTQQVDCSALSGYHLFDPGTEFFSPPMFGFGAVIPVAFANRMSMTVSFHRNPITATGGIYPTDTAAPASCTVNPIIAPAFNVPIQMGWRLQTYSPGDIVAGSGSGAFNLDAVEFWPFKNSLNEPVYDTGNGNQLNDPFG